MAGVFDDTIWSVAMFSKGIQSLKAFSSLLFVFNSLCLSGSVAGRVLGLADSLRLSSEDYVNVLLEISVVWELRLYFKGNERLRVVSVRLIKAGLGEEEASRWASYYIDVRDRFHGGCFYG